MGAMAVLGAKAIKVDPGSETTLTVTVRNTGQVVDQFTIDVLGDAATWAVPEPPTLSLFPGAEGSATIAFRPPRQSSIPAGSMPFGVRVRSQEDAAGSVVEEGVVDVGAFAETSAELLPRTSRGSRGANHDLAVDNRGNVRLNSTLSAFDQDKLLDFSVQPPSIVADPGTAAFAKVRVKPKQRFWRGTAKTRQFQVFVQPEGGNPVTLEGSLLQEAMLPSWFIPALIALAAILIAAIVLWLTVLKPTFNDIAGERAKEVLASAGITLPPPTPAGATPPGGAPTPPGGGATPPGGAATPAASGAGSGSPTPAPSSGGIPGVSGAPVSGRLDSTTIALDTGADTIYITDLVFSNPNGDSGTLKLVRRDASGEQILMDLKLDNFRDLDFHFVTPIVVGPKAVLELQASCGTACSPALLYSGFKK